MTETNKEKELWLKSIYRGFGGDNATYNTKTSPQDIFTVAVGWGLTIPHTTNVFKNGEKIAEFDGPEYIQPHEALSRLGYIVHGTVDFAECINLEKKDEE